MLLADYIFIITLIIFMIIGLILGFKKQINIFKHSFMLVILAILIAIIVSPVLLNLSFIQIAENYFNTEILKENSFWLNIQVFRIILGAVLFLFVYLIVNLFSSLINKLFSEEHKGLSFVNKFLGLIASVLVFVFILIVVVNVDLLVQNNAFSIGNILNGSAIHLDKIYEWITKYINLQQLL